MLEQARLDSLNTSNVSRRDVTWRAKWNLGYTQKNFINFNKQITLSFGEFKAKNLASSSNDLQELFGKETSNWVAKWYFGNIVLTFMPDCHRSFQYKLCTLRL